MSRTRRIVSGVVAAVLVGTGTYLLASHLMLGERLSMRLLLASSFLVIVGTIWLWVDAIAPVLNSRQRA